MIFVQSGSWYRIFNLLTDILRRWKCYIENFVPKFTKEQKQNAVF